MNDTETAPAPTIAGIVVNYNYEAYVGSAVESLLDQSSSFDEVLVVDDGSTDQSLAVIRAFEPRIRVVTKENGGQLSAVLAAVAATSCDYVYVLDADDVALPTLVARVARHLTPGTVKVQFQLHGMDQDANPVDSVFPTYGDAYGSPQMVADNRRLGFYVCPPTSGNVFDRRFLLQIAAFDLDQREAFDGVPAQAAPYFGRVVSLNEELVRYRIHDSSDSRWGRPTPELLRSEIARFEARWTELSAILEAEGLDATPPRATAFVLERRLMIAALETRWPSPKESFGYVSAILHSGLESRQRLTLSLWAVAVAALPRASAARLVVDRRSPKGRGRLAAFVARTVRRR